MMHRADLVKLKVYIPIGGVSNELSFSEKMLCWIKKPAKVSATCSAILSGTYLLQADDVEIQEEFLTECLETDLCPLQQYMTGKAWATLMEEKLNGTREQEAQGP